MVWGLIWILNVLTAAPPKTKNASLPISNPVISPNKWNRFYIVVIITSTTTIIIVVITTTIIVTNYDGLRSGWRFFLKSMVMGTENTHGCFPLTLKFDSPPWISDRLEDIDFQCFLMGALLLARGTHGVVHVDVERKVDQPTFKHAWEQISMF